MIPETEIKAVVTDIDGTITDKHQLIDVNVILALRKVQAKGIHVCIASGNVVPVAYAVSNYIGLRGPVIAENGGVVSYKKKNYQLFSSELPRKALAYLESQMPVTRLFSDQWRLSAVSLDNCMSIEKVKAALKDFDIAIEETGFAIHLLNKGQNKAVGVKKAAELLNIKMNETAAFGDSDNDKEMLKECGYGIAVANGSVEACASADYVCKEKYGTGVIEGLSRLGLL